MAVTVPRPRLNWRERMYLPAIVAGLAITLKHFKNMLLGRTKVTMQYPEEKWDSSLPDHYRGAPALVRDSDGRVRCVACQLCEFICPPRAIKIIPGEINDVLVHFVPGGTNRARGDNTTHRNNRHFGGTATNINDHTPNRFLNR